MNPHKGYSRSGQKLEAIKPFATIPKSDKGDYSPKDLLPWLENAYAVVDEGNEGRESEIRANWSIFVNDHAQEEIGSVDRNKQGTESYYASRKPRVVSNDIHEIVENRTSKLISFVPTTIPVPATSELQDRNAVKPVKRVLETLRYINDFKRSYEDLARESFIAGESFAFVTWDPCKGDYDPDYLKAKAKAEKKGLKTITLPDPETGKDVKYKLSEIPEEVKRIGDVRIDTSIPAEDVFLDPQSKSQDVKWVMIRKYVHVEELRLDYPKLAHEIEATKEIGKYDPELHRHTDLEDHVLVLEFWHKSTKHCPEGAYVKFTPEVVLESSENPIPPVDGCEFGNLPIVRMVDLKKRGQLRGISSFRILWPLQNQRDGLTTALVRNAKISSVPLLIAPEESKHQIIRDTKTGVVTVRYRAAAAGFAPQLSYANVINPAVDAIRERLKAEMQTLSGVHGISRGEPPTGIKAGIALRLMEQVENQRARTVIERFNRVVEEIDRKVLAIIGKYYTNDDGRMIRIMGRGNDFEIESFDASVLNKPYDVRLEKVSGLSQSPAARTQQLIDLREAFPGLVTDEFAADSLDLSQPDRFIHMITVAVQAADSENEDLASGKDVNEPEEWEDHAVHWVAHMKLMQKRSFKDDWTEKAREQMKEHVQVHEMLMVESARKNPLLLQKFLSLNGWPTFFPLTPDLQQLLVGSMSPQPSKGKSPNASSQPTNPAPSDTLAPEAQPTADQLT